MDLWSFELADGAVQLGSVPAKSFIPDPDGDNVLGAPVAELLWPPQLPGTLLSAAHGQRRCLTVGSIDCASLSYAQRQTLTLAVEEHDPAAEFHCHLALSPDGRTLVVGNTLRSEVYVLRVDAAAGSFGWAAAFSVGAPMLSLAAVFPAETGGASEDEDVRLYCQQANAVAQCRVSLAVCEPEANAAPAGAPAGKKEGKQEEEEEEDEEAGSNEEEEEDADGEDAAAAKVPPSPSSLPTPAHAGSGRFPPPPDTPAQPRTPPPTPAGGPGETEPLPLPIAGLRLLSPTSSSLRDRSGDAGSPGPSSEGGASTPHSAPKPHVSFSGVPETVPPPPKPHVSFSDELRAGEQRAPNPPKPHVSFSDEKQSERGPPHPPKPHVSFSDGTAPGKPDSAGSSSRLSGSGSAAQIIPDGAAAGRVSSSGGDVLSELQLMEARLLSALSAKARRRASRPAARRARSAFRSPLCFSRARAD